MMNSEIATAVAMRQRITVVLLDNGGFGCIGRLQRATGGAPFNNLLEQRVVDFRAHAESLGAIAEQVDDIAGLEAALGRARQADRTTVLVIATDPAAATQAGGHWWDVAVPELSARPEVVAARAEYDRKRQTQQAGG
jgi:3D-(3,5/4)-trihydroxycyclohexane-1,2-dione acylhydrolase (decyclizing)